MRTSVVVVITGVLLIGTTVAKAQHIHHGPRYHVDHHDHVVQDSHGHVIGRYHHDVVHRDSSYVVPHHDRHHHGTYYSHGGRYYYAPQTIATPGRHTTLRPTVTQVTFGGFSHVDDLAGRLEALANEFCLDLHYNYSHNPGYRETYREAYEILQVAKYIHAAEHQHDRAAIQERLGGLDQNLHHVQRDVRGWSRHHHRQVGKLGILSKLDLMESTLHHLMQDVGVRPTPAPQQAPPPGNGAVQQAPAPLTTAPPPTIQ